MKKHYLKIVFIFLYTAPLLSFAQRSIANLIVDNNNDHNNVDGECSIVINRQSPNHILAAANPDIIYRSSDGGQTWIESKLSTFSSNNLLGDVTITTNSNGDYFYQSLAQAWKMHTLRSSDFGATWNTETILGANNGALEDKNWIAADNITGSSFNGNLYCAWTKRAYQGSLGYLLFTHSSDNGQTWSVKDTLHKSNYSPSPPIGAGLAIGPQGEVNVSWCGTGANKIYFKKSTDAGQTWPLNVTVVDNNVHPTGSYGSGISHANNLVAQFTSLACDVSTGTYSGNLYCTWADMRNGTNNADIFLAISSNGGQTWTTKRINDDNTTRNQILPSVTVDPTSGYVYLAYLDARLNKDNFDDTLHYYMAWSMDGGQTFHNIQVSQQPSVRSYLLSDYMGIDAYAGNVHLLWAAANPSNSPLKIWTAKINQTTLALNENMLHANTVQLFPAYPNPAIDFINFDFALNEESNVTFIISDLNGKEVLRLIDNKNYSKGNHQLQFNNDYLPAGMYIASLLTPNSSAKRKITLIK